MLVEIPLNNKFPNQRVSSLINNQNITVDLFTVNEFIFVNVYIAGEIILAGVRAVHASYINDYITNLNGKLFFYCEDELDPTYDRLGNICHLMYSDFDALENDYISWRANNLQELQERIGI